jgi:hypothetical protein
MMQWVNHRSRRIATLALILTFVVAAACFWETTAEKRVRVIVPGRVVRGAWQNPEALRRLIDREHIKTIVTLTAINRDDAKYVGQAGVVRQTGVNWIIIPMCGSTATIEQMAEAADLLADPNRQPVFFHCVGGHHRTGLTHAAYLIRHAGCSADEAWRVLAGLPWTRPSAPADQKDRALIGEFARLQATIAVGPSAGKS